MKRKIALFLAVVMAVGTIANLTACKKTDEGSDPSATEPSDLLTQAPTETSPSETESNEDYKNDIVYYPFPLLDMTYKEIINKYPDAEIEGGPQGTVRLTCEQLLGIAIIFSLNDEYDVQTNPVPEDLKPRRIEITGKVYPGIQVGMKYADIDFDNIPNHEFYVAEYQEIHNFILLEYILVEDCEIQVQISPNGLSLERLPWEIVEKYLGYNITEDEAWKRAMDGGEIVLSKDILNWLQNGHMDEIADFKIATIEIYRND